MRKLLRSRRILRIAAKQQRKRAAQLQMASDLELPSKDSQLQRSTSSTVELDTVVKIVKKNEPEPGPDLLRRVAEASLLRAATKGQMEQEPHPKNQQTSKGLLIQESKPLPQQLKEQEQPSLIKQEPICQQTTSSSNQKPLQQEKAAQPFQPQKLQQPPLPNQQQLSQLMQKFVRVSGLQNVGNSCYFNSALQCVINTPGFNHLFLTEEIKKQLNPRHKQVALSYMSLLKRMRSPGHSSYENPVQLKQAIANATKKFKGFKQEDSQEFLRALLTSLHEDLNRITSKPLYKELQADLTKQSLQEISNTWFNYFKGRDDSIVTDYFTGQLLSRVVCQTCKHESIAFDNFQDLSLAFNNSCQSIQDMLKFYLQVEEIKSYVCSKCRQQRRCQRHLEIWRLPEILVIHLKRFLYKGPYRSKINTSVRYDASLNMGSFISSSKDKSTERSQYQLYGLVKHYGDLNSGHYFAECKNPFLGKWYQLNDSSVSEIKEKCGFETDASAYLLFYSKC